MADGLSALVVDGKVQTQTASSVSLSTVSGKSGSTLDKDAFLQLLVAQMKYQDPLEPTDNTEYISQLANFSSLEEMQNMNASMSLQRASSYVGQEVIVKATNPSTGQTDVIQGVVDYVVYENNKAFVAIDESLYSVDDIYEVIDSEYSEAYGLAARFVSALASFPNVNELTLDYEEAVTTLRKTYEDMNAYQKTFIAKDVVERLEAYEAKIKELNLAKGSLTDKDAENTEASE